MDLNDTNNIVEDHVSEVIDDVRGAGSIVKEFVGKDKETSWKTYPIIAATTRACPVNIIRQFPGPKNPDTHA